MNNIMLKNPEYDDLFKTLVSQIVDIYGDNINAIILYGSVARNEAGEESDIDIALIIEKENDDMHGKLMTVIGDIDLDFDCVIAPSLIEKERFEHWKAILPYYRNIDNEGIVLWTAA